jgi:uncharacterized cupin superfamily protein
MHDSPVTANAAWGVLCYEASIRPQEIADTPEGAMQRINIEESEFTYEAGDPEGFRAGRLSIGPLVGARETGASVYEVPPGEAICPYHFEYGEEEWLMVLEGHPTLRHPDGSDELAPWDVVCFPTGPAGAHGVRNGTADTVRVLMFSNLKLPAVSAYPDSDKIGVWTGNEDDDIMVRRSSGVEYYDGETG